MAAGLTGAGAKVQIWARPARGEGREVGGVTFHREAGRWSRDDLMRLGRCLNAFPPPRRPLVQYQPWARGDRAMNLGLCRWLVRRREARDDAVSKVHKTYIILNIYNFF
jgi:hypothetical protein